MEPSSARTPEHMHRRLDAGIVVERADGEYHLAAAPCQMREWRSASPTEGGGETPRLRQVMAHDAFFSVRPAEGLRIDDRVGRESTAGRLAAARAMAVHELTERQPRLVPNRPAQAASMYKHSTPLSANSVSCLSSIRHSDAIPVP